ncbi:MAG: hypothetical protein JXA13_16310 [Anaerolineales bacterium]|nr:hypothetical protein [Anaerolineales bacterium]
MNLQTIIKELDLQVLTTPKDFTKIIPAGGYVSDLLSCVMVGAEAGDLWITLQSHANVVAVAALTEAAATIITENARPDDSVIEKANSQDVILLLTPQASYEVAGKLWNLGIK